MTIRENIAKQLVESAETKKKMVELCLSDIEKAEELMIGAVRITPEDVMKTVWKKILVWFWDLQYKNALAENESMLKKLREIGSG